MIIYYLFANILKVKEISIDSKVGCQVLGMFYVGPCSGPCTSLHKGRMDNADKLIIPVNVLGTTFVFLNHRQGLWIKRADLVGFLSAFKKHISEVTAAAAATAAAPAAVVLRRCPLSKQASRLAGWRARGRQAGGRFGNTFFVHQERCFCLIDAAKS